MLTGTAPYQYEWNGHWARLGELAIGKTHGIALDAHGHIYVFNQSGHAMLVFADSGELLNTWGPASPFAAGAHYIKLVRRADGAEAIWLTDHEMPGVVLVDLEGNELQRLAPPDLPSIYDAERKFKPTDVAVAPGGDIFVADGYGQHYIHRYSADGTYRATFGGRGADPGQVACPHGIWFDTRGSEPLLCVADRANHRLQRFTLDGRHHSFFHHEALRRPCTATLDGDILYIPDLDGAVWVYEEKHGAPTGRLLSSLGDNPGVNQTPGWPHLPQDQLREGLFNSPHGLLLHPSGDLIIVEWHERGRITRLVRK